MAKKAPPSKQGGLTRKYGPLPLWGWIAVGVGAVYLYRKEQASSAANTAANTAATTTATNANNAYNSGYQQALSDALAGGVYGGSPSGIGGGGSSGSTSLPTSTQSGSSGGYATSSWLTSAAAQIPAVANTPLPVITQAPPPTVNVASQPYQPLAPPPAGSGLSIQPGSSYGSPAPQIYVPSYITPQTQFAQPGVAPTSGQLAAGLNPALLPYAPVSGAGIQHN